MVKYVFSIDPDPGWEGKRVRKLRPVRNVTNVKQIQLHYSEAITRYGQWLSEAASRGGVVERSDHGFLLYKFPVKLNIYRFKNKK